MADPNDQDALGIPQGGGVPGGRLYRYRPFGATELRLLLVAGQTRFADPSYFNDPWDCRPRFEAEQPRDKGDRDRINEEVIRLVANANPGLNPAIHAKFAEVIRQDSSALQRFYEDRSEETVRGLRNRYRVLCLSGSGAVPLMWSHYAKAHRGICLIFDAANPIIGGAYQVQYAEDYPVIVIPGELGNQGIVKSFLTKPKDWKYEDEYRAVAREYRQGDDNPWQPRSHQGFVSVSQGALIGVILGAFMDASDEAWARDLIAAAPHTAEVWHARLEPNRYALRTKQETSPEPVSVERGTLCAWCYHLANQGSNEHHIRRARQVGMGSIGHHNNCRLAYLSRWASDRKLARHQQRQAERI